MKRFLLFVLLSGCVVQNTVPNNVRVYFTPGTDCENNIIREIKNADKIDIAVYSITNENITDAIIAAHKRGANVRIVSDKLQSRGKHSRVDELRAAGVPVLINKKHKIEHNKFAIFDNQTVVTGSYNWTTSATKYNSENCVFIDYPTPYVNRFEYLWREYK